MLFSEARLSKNQKSKNSSLRKETLGYLSYEAFRQVKKCKFKSTKITFA